MIKSIEKLKLKVDQNLNRAEKTEALSEDVVKIENKVTCLKQVCSSVSKKLSDSVTSASVKGNDGAAVEKRIRKTTEFALGQTFQENGRAYSQHDQTREPSARAMSQFLVEGGLLLNDLAANQVQYEIGVEKLVLNALSSLLEETGPPMNRERKNLLHLLWEYDAAKNKLVSYRTKEANNPSNNETSEGSREEKLAAELSDIENKLNNSREINEVLMLQFLSKEGEVGGLLLRYFELKRDYHKRVSERIERQVNAFRTSLNSSAISPVYGASLRSHLNRNSTLTASRIAFPLRLCVFRMLKLDALREEGLFRVAAPSLKIRRLVALIDAGECNDDDASHANDVEDVHVFAGALKLYLRELPEPLMCCSIDDSGGDMYREWLAACACSKTDRRGAIAALLHTLTPDARLNLQYVLAFLKKVAGDDRNKMTSSNLGIVMAPNLLFPTTSVAATVSSPPASATTVDLGEANVVNEIVESVILDYDYYFGSDPPLDLMSHPPCLIGRKNTTTRSTNSALLLNKTTSFNRHSTPPLPPVSSNCGVNSEDNERKSLSNNSGGASSYQEEAPGSPKATSPPVPSQRTPVPKPRGSRVSKTNHLPPRPSERPSLKSQQLPHQNVIESSRFHQFNSTKL